MKRRPSKVTRFEDELDLELVRKALSETREAVAWESLKEVLDGPAKRTD